MSKSTKIKPQALGQNPNKTDNYILTRISSTESNYFAWRKTVTPRVSSTCPNVVQEILADPPNETIDERNNRLSACITWPVERDERTDCISDEAYARVMGTPVGTVRKRQEVLEIAAVREENRIANVAIRKQVLSAQQTLKNLIDKAEKQEAERLSLSAMLISKEFMSEECLKQVRAHGSYNKGNDATNSPFVLMTIIKSLFSGSGAPSPLRRLEQENILRSIKQGTVPLHVYVESFTDQVDRCEAEGSTFGDPRMLIGLFIWGLNIDIFADYINEYNDDPTSKPNTVNLAMTDVSNWYETRMGTDPRLRNILEGHDPTGNFGAFASTGVEDGETKIVCQLCGKEKHTAIECFKLLDSDFMEDLRGTVKLHKKALDDKRKGDRGAPKQG